MEGGCTVASIAIKDFVAIGEEAASATISGENAVAQELIRDLSQRVIDGSIDSNRIYSHLWAIESFIRKIGWMIDLGLNEIDEIPGKGGPEDWFMSPMYLEGAKRFRAFQEGKSS